MQLFVPPTGQGPYASRPSPMRGLHRVGRIGRLCLPIVAIASIGFGISNFINSQSQNQYRSVQEEERLQRNAQLMDAYGDKTSLDDVQRALELYKKD